MTVPGRIRGSGRRTGGAPQEPQPVDTGTVELVPDPDRPAGWTLVLDGAGQSHVDLDDPTYLEFEYVRRLGHVVDLVAEPGRPLDVVHLGAGALTLARYVAATRPRSRQRAFEIDAALVDLVRRELPLPRSCRVRISVGDARAGLGRLASESADLVVGDVFSGGRTPAPLTTVEFVSDVARVLRASGTYALNVADGPPLAFARGQVATAVEVFPELCVIADPGVLRGRRFGNLVVVASPAALPLVQLSRRCAGDPAPARVVDGADLRRFAGRAVPVHDNTAVASPPPPDEVVMSASRRR